MNSDASHASSNASTRGAQARQHRPESSSLPQLRCVLEHMEKPDVERFVAGHPGPAIDRTPLHPSVDRCLSHKPINLISASLGNLSATSRARFLVLDLAILLSLWNLQVF